MRSIESRRKTTVREAQPQTRGKRAKNGAQPPKGADRRKTTVREAQPPDLAEQGTGREASVSVCTYLVPEWG